jgi:hypothetical protein
MSQRVMDEKDPAIDASPEQVEVGFFWHGKLWHILILTVLFLSLLFQKETCIL